MPLFIIGAFLLLTLAVGIYFSRQKTTFREYAVGNKQFATATLVATVLATAYSGGGLVRNVQCFHNLGLSWILFMFLDSCFSFWIIICLALRMGRFMQHLSMTETIGSIYGKYPRIITALFSIASSIILIATQVYAMSLAIRMCLGVDSVNNRYITALVTLILIFYSTFGGVRAVTYTDVLQFITFTIIIPFLAYFMFINTGKPVAEICAFLQSQEKFQFSNVFRFDTKLLAMLFLLLSSLIGGYIEPPMIQRIYMSSSPIQAKKVFLYSTLFSIVIMLVIILIGLFVFSGAPELPIENVWDYIMAHVPPVFKGLVAISLLAMAMSTADSKLNACSVMISHDIVKSFRNIKAVPYIHQLRLARISTLVVGLFAMMVTFYLNDLLELLKLSMDFALPILPAPFILAVFGFRGTSRTALIGMATGVLTILAWNKWVEPSTKIDGSFVSMVANGLAMMLAHYLLKQPKSAGWVKPDNEFEQMQQENARKRAEQKEVIKNSWANRKNTLEKLMPSDSTLYLTGLYTITTAILSYWFVTPDRIYWAIGQALLGAVFIGSKTFFSKISRGWCTGLGWLMGLVVYLPLNVLLNWWSLVNPIFTTSLSLIHFAIILWVLPLYLGIGVVVATSFVAMYPIAIGWSLPALSSLFPLFITHLLVLSIIICLKVKQGNLTTQMLYLSNQQKIREVQQLKASLYEAALVPSNGATSPKPRGYGCILNQVVRKSVKLKNLSPF